MNSERTAGGIADGDHLQALHPPKEDGLSQAVLFFVRQAHRIAHVAQLRSVLLLPGRRRAGEAADDGAGVVSCESGGLLGCSRSGTLI